MLDISSQVREYASFCSLSDMERIMERERTLSISEKKMDRVRSRTSSLPRTCWITFKIGALERRRLLLQGTYIV